MVLLVGSISSCFAQELGKNERPSWLKQNDSPQSLAEEALASGDPVRGAIIFPRANLACSSCHIANGIEQVGPDLSKLNKDRSNTYLVESILEPSKSVGDGYKVATVVTTDGELFRGRLISNENGQVVLREGVAPFRRLIWKDDQIEEVASDTISLMPNGLANLLDRQEFLDLVRYLMELRDSSSPIDAAPALARVELPPHLKGRVILDRFQCRNCHENDLADSNPITPHAAPKLSWVSQHLNPKYIKAFLSTPHQTKPGTHMPHLLAKVPDNKRALVATQLTHYLLSQSESSYREPVVDKVAAARGHDLFHSVGCVTCHAPRDGNGKEIACSNSVSLGPIAYSLEGLAAFLEDPLKSRPSGRMPDLKLTHWEAVDLANYLLSIASPANHSGSDGPFKADAELARAGKTHFDAFKCADCHMESDTAPKQSRPENLAFSKLDLEQGCLSGELGPWPVLNFGDTERTLMKDAIATWRQNPELENEQRIQLSLETFRCSECHSRGSFGGARNDRDDYFQTTNPNLGPQGRIPPTLTAVGAKMRPKWMREVLVSGRAIRPYVKTRMPQFGTENVEHFVELFQTTDSLPPVDFPEVRGREKIKETRIAGFELVSNSGLNCIACHTFQLKPAQTMPAVDLTEMHERLKPDWFYHFMSNPKSFNKGTVMPSFWPSGRATRKDILEGDPHQQIAAIWEWMKEGRQARTPRGLVREPMELLATNEAVMLRRKYPGIGKRGIGVGYPSLINIAFDAEQMRVGTLWPGKFVDPAGVWRSQGHGTVRPLSRAQVSFRPGPEIDSLRRPWEPDDGRPPQHRFKGYELDELRRPTFEYQFDDEVGVKDRFVDGISDRGNPTLTRTLRLTSETPRDDLAVRLRPTKAIRFLSENKYQTDRLQITIGDDHRSEIEPGLNGEDCLLIYPGKISGRPMQIQIEYEWPK